MPVSERPDCLNLQHPGGPFVPRLDRSSSRLYGIRSSQILEVFALVSQPLFYTKLAHPDKKNVIRQTVRLPANPT